MSEQTHQDFYAIVLGGARSKAGMPAFGQILSVAEADAIRGYIIDRAHKAWDQSTAADSDQR